MSSENTSRKFSRFSFLMLRYLGFLGILGIWWKPMKLFFLFFLIGLYEDFKFSRKKKEGEPDLSGYYRTSALSNLNPLTLFQAALQITGQLIIHFRHKRLPSAESYQCKASYILPFRGEWLAVNGGVLKADSHSWDILTQRYAYDFLISDDGERSFRNSGKLLEDYYCYEQPVISPAEGIVVKVRSNVRDHTRVGDYSIDWKTRDFRGNFVIIKHAEKEYSFIAHLKKDSVAVKAGDKVKQGQVIGLCGNSGHSTEPHIHFHLQDSSSFWIAAGLPVRFGNFSARAPGKETEEVRSSSFVSKNEIVKNL